MSLLPAAAENDAEMSSIGRLGQAEHRQSWLRSKIPEFVAKGEFGLASGAKADGTYEAVWFEQPISSDEVMFEPGVFLLTKEKARALKSGAPPVVVVPPGPPPPPPPPNLPPAPPGQLVTLNLSGTVPPEVWNRLGTKILPKLKAGEDLQVGVHFTVTVRADVVQNLQSDLQQILKDLGLSDKVSISES